MQIVRRFPFSSKNISIMNLKFLEDKINVKYGFNFQDKIYDILQFIVRLSF